MDMMIAMHTVAAVVAILCGLVVVFRPKGSALHKRVGKVYTVSIIAMIILSAFIREINHDQFSIFHLISIQTFLFVAAGMLSQIFRDRIRHWYLWHARFMLYSYVTLIVTGIAQAFEYLPFSDIVNAIVFIQCPALVGWALVEFVGMPRWRRIFAPMASSGW